MVRIDKLAKLLGVATLTLALALGLAARPIAAVNKSLVLDEFHTWYHATRPGVAAFFQSLVRDNHPPLGFINVAAARALLGSSELALRVPAQLFGLLEILLLAWFGARLQPQLGTRFRRLGLAAAALLAASSLHVDYGSQSRMYALHALLATVTLVSTHTLLTAARARRAQIALTASLTLAFHTHYFGGHYVIGAALAALTLAAFDREVRGRLRRAVAPIVAASLLCSPWAWFGFRRQLEHRLPPGGDDLDWHGLAEAFVHFFFHNVRLGGPELRLAFIGAGAVAFALGAVGVLRLLREPRTRAAGALVAMAAFGVPVLSWAIANLTPRAGFTWHYTLPSAAPMALLAVVGAWTLGVFGRLLFTSILGLALALTALNVDGPGTEDFRGAVRALLARHRPGDAVIAVEWQPGLFPQGQPYDYYAPRLSQAPPERLPMRDFSVQDPLVLDGLQRVIVVRKSLPADQALFDELRARFEPVAQDTFGFSLDVTVWQRK